VNKYSQLALLGYYYIEVEKQGNTAIYLHVTDIFYSKDRK